MDLTHGTDKTSTIIWLLTLGNSVNRLVNLAYSRHAKVISVHFLYVRLFTNLHWRDSHIPRSMFREKPPSLPFLTLSSNSLLPLAQSFENVQDKGIPQRPFRTTGYRTLCSICQEIQDAIKMRNR